MLDHHATLDNMLIAYDFYNEQEGQQARQIKKRLCRGIWVAKKGLERPNTTIKHYLKYVHKRIYVGDFVRLPKFGVFGKVVEKIRRGNIKSLIILRPNGRNLILFEKNIRVVPQNHPF